MVGCGDEVESNRVLHLYLRIKLMSNRSANATILGYLYQFDFSINKILDSQENDEIELEGLEDIDITQDNETNLYQCKYYSGTEYNHSVIKPAITSMFNHFQKNKNKNKHYKYYLYGHFKSGTEKYYNHIDSKEKENKLIKEHLISSDEETVSKLDDIEFNSFRERLKINIKAPCFEEQESEIIEKLKKFFPKHDDSSFVESVYLSNARTIISKLSSKKEGRTITKKELIDALLEKKENIENYILFPHNTQYIKNVKNCIKQQYLKTGTITRKPASRFFFLDITNEEFETLGKAIISSLIIKYHEKFSCIHSNRTDYFYPFFILPNLSNENLNKIKNELYLNGKFVLDEYPFNGSNKSYIHVIDERFNNNNFRPIKILSSHNEIINILEEIKKQNEVLLKEIQIFDFYRTSTIKISAENLLSFHFPQNSVDMLEEFIS